MLELVPAAAVAAAPAGTTATVVTPLIAAVRRHALVPIGRGIVVVLLVAPVFACQVGCFTAAHRQQRLVHGVARRVVGARAVAVQHVALVHRSRVVLRAAAVAVAMRERLVSIVFVHPPVVLAELTVQQDDGLGAVRDVDRLLLAHAVGH